MKGKGWGKFSMKRFIYQTGYFLTEVKKLVQLNWLSHLLSFLSTGLIFFLLALVISGGWICGQVMEAIQGEAEINVFFKEDLNPREVDRLVKEIRALDGVRETRLVGEKEAYDRMVELLGKEARVWEFFDDNPFSAFIEAKIDLTKANSIRANLDRITGVEHVRDNQEILERLSNISQTGRLLGYLITVAVGVSTLVIISHLVRLGIDKNREQISTLRLLGAPESFIAIPFLLTGLLITWGGGMLAALFAGLTLKQIYLQTTGPLPFLPLPPLGSLVTRLVILLPGLGILLGLAGGIFGLWSARDND